MLLFDVALLLCQITMPGAWDHCIICMLLERGTMQKLLTLSNNYCTAVRMLNTKAVYNIETFIFPLTLYPTVLLILSNICIPASLLNVGLNFFLHKCVKNIFLLLSMSGFEFDTKYALSKVVYIIPLFAFLFAVTLLSCQITMPGARYVCGHCIICTQVATAGNNLPLHRCHIQR